MTTTGATWTWQAGTLYRRRTRSWVGDAVMHAFAGLALLLIPAAFLVPALRDLAGTSWGWSAEACVTVRGGTWCAPAWVFVAVGGAVLVGWLVALLDVVRTTVVQSRETEISLHLDAHSLHVTIPPSFWRRPSPVSVRWADVDAVELPPRGTRTLLLRLAPGAEVTPRNGLAPQRSVTRAAEIVAIECGDARSDAAVLRHILAAGAHQALATAEGAADSLQRAGV